MSENRIEQYMDEMKLQWERIVKGMWSVEDPEGKLPEITLSVEPGLKKGEDILKFTVFICDVPVNEKPEFFREFLKMNFRVEHGTFAMETGLEMIFVDTLEMANLDQNEFEQTMNAMQGALKIFSERYDIIEYTF